MDIEHTQAHFEIDLSLPNPSTKTWPDLHPMVTLGLAIAKHNFS